MDKISKKQILTGKYGLVGGEHSIFVAGALFVMLKATLHFLALCFDLELL